MIKQLETEQDFVNKLIPTFSKHFKVETEVWSKCKNGRIDLLLNLDNKYYFGIECKLPNAKRGEQIGKYVKQAIRYSNYEFHIGNGIYKKIPIFICPPLSYKYFLMNQRETIIDNIDNVYCNGNKFKKWHQDRHCENSSHHSFNGFLGEFNVGEVRRFDNVNYYFSFSNNIIYELRNGIDEKRYVKLLKKLSI